MNGFFLQELCMATRRQFLKTTMIATIGAGDVNRSVQPVRGPGEQYWSHFTGDTVATSPAVQESFIYFADDSGIVTALNKASQIRLWEFSTDNAIKSSPTVVNQVLFVGSRDGSIYAINTDTGEKKWQVDTGSAVDSSPTVVDGTVYVGSDDENLYAIDATSGERRWVFETDGRIKSSPVVVDQTVFFGSWDNGIYAIDTTTGRKRWNVRTNGRIETSVTVSNETVYATSSDNVVYAFDVFTGDEKWTYEISTGGISTPTVGAVEPYVRDTLYVQDQMGTLHALNAKLGGSRWEFNPVDKESRRQQDSITAPAIVQNTVLFGNQNGLYAVDGGDSEIEWKTGDQTSSAPIVSDGTVYFGSGDNFLAKNAGYSIASGDGSRTWLGTFGHPVDWKYADQTFEEDNPESSSEKTTQNQSQNQSADSFDREPEIEDVQSNEQPESSQPQDPPDFPSGTSQSGNESNHSFSINSDTTILAGFTGIVMLTVGWIFGKLSG
jgi:outer membrane protein assembly factor BamB